MNEEDEKDEEVEFDGEFEEFVDEEEIIGNVSNNWKW